MLLLITSYKQHRCCTDTKEGHMHLYSPNMPAWTGIGRSQTRTIRTKDVKVA